MVLHSAMGGYNAPMSDSKLPDYDSEPNEWESNRPVKFPRHIEVAIKMYKARIQSQRTMQGLVKMKKEIIEGSLTNNLAAKDMLKRDLNRRARDLGAKAPLW